MNYEGISSTALFSGLTLDYSDPCGLPLATSSAGPGYLCVKNQSTDTAYSVNLALENVVSLDLGCDPDEVTVGDIDCAALDPGELGNGALSFNCSAVMGGGSSCESDGGSLADQAFNGIANLDPSGWCAWDISLWDTNALILAIAPDPIYSSDDVTFDVVLKAEDSVVLTTWWPDDDGDGYGDGTQTSFDLFFGLTGYVDNDTDCDDDHALINPGQPEVPGNGIDDN